MENDNELKLANIEMALFQYSEQSLSSMLKTKNSVSVQLLGYEYQNLAVDQDYFFKVNHLKLIDLSLGTITQLNDKVKIEFNVTGAYGTSLLNRENMY